MIQPKLYYILHVSIWVLLHSLTLWFCGMDVLWQVSGLRDYVVKIVSLELIKKYFDCGSNIIINLIISKKVITASLFGLCKNVIFKSFERHGTQTVF